MKEITQPNISEQTMEEMKHFFMKTSIPRILEQRREKMKLNVHPGQSPKQVIRKPANGTLMSI
ncbi:hypothetical protein [Lentibacillus cibarius]|uniref:Uncharacterized protein n=1 Tax=Lentibacillus cibarius TaxID=2583219 RepID=A0A5S3QGC7_9BACI|nr:hypothetical protein [Lentibacillus cibarius]TMN20952.1 hypothetical protein FFL34_01620 [Lentibacillus cibarius]